jgi:hypothetical protein
MTDDKAHYSTSQRNSNQKEPNILAFDRENVKILRIDPKFHVVMIFENVVFCGYRHFGGISCLHS